jgi:hypothetical protein
MPTKEDMDHLTNTYTEGDRDKMARIFLRALNSEEFNQLCKDWMMTEADRAIWQDFIDTYRKKNQRWNDRINK